MSAGGSTLAAVLALGYLGVGAALAWELGRRGHGLGVRVSALCCWPLLLGLRGRPAPDPSVGVELCRAEPRGPHAARIDACLRALAASLREHEAHGVRLIDAEQWARLGEALDRADRRVARVDALLAEAEAERQRLGDVGLDPLLAALRAARAHAHHELEGVLAGLLQLRFQLGLASLVDDGEGIRERVAELEDRVAALTELASIELARVRS